MNPLAEALLHQMVQEGIVSPASGAALMQACLEQGPTRPPIREPLTMDRKLRLTQRTIRVFGELLNGLQSQVPPLRFPARMAIAVAQTLWAALEAATPASLFGAFLRHWYGLLVLFGLVMILIGTLHREVAALVSGGLWLLGVLLLFGAVNMLVTSLLALGAPRVRVSPATLQVASMLTIVLAVVGFREGFRHHGPMLALKSCLGLQATLLSVALAFFGALTIKLLNAAGFFLARAWRRASPLHLRGSALRLVTKISLYAYVASLTVLIGSTAALAIRGVHYAFYGPSEPARHVAPLPEKPNADLGAWLDGHIAATWKGVFALVSHRSQGGADGTP